MTLNIFYKQFSGNDSFETTEDRQSVYLDKIEAEHPGILCTMEAAIERSILGLPLVNQDTLEQSLSYIVTNNASCGAIALFYRGAMERFAQLIGSFFVMDIRENVVCGIECGKNGKQFLWANHDEWLGELNDLVFLTREAAEKKLEEF